MPDEKPLRRRDLAALGIGLAVLGLAAGLTRRHFIRAFFRDAPAGAAPALRQPAGPIAGLRPATRVRVLLIDGLDAATARSLPVLNTLCRGGLDLAVDVGFPTVSLPVQAVLWTGWTQQQSGLLYRIAPLITPPPDAVPVRVPGSVAVSEDQPLIARSFGFRAPATPPRADEVPGFAHAALTAAASASRLAFVHVLRVDKAGHKGGTADSSYRPAAIWADDLLGRLLRSAPPTGALRWFVLSDHGHRRTGGHGGAEAAVRTVRACIAGGGLPAGQGEAPTGSTIHLVDLARAVSDSLGLPPLPGTVGRPLAFARTHPDPGATLPHLNAVRAALAALAFLAAIAAWLGRRWTAGTLARLPLWLPAAYLSILLVRGLPTLSNPIVYPPTGRDAIVAGAPGLLYLGIVLLFCVRRTPTQLGAVCRAQLALPAGAAAACLIACGGIEALFHAGVGPPLLPLWTAHASVLLSLLAAASFTLALTVLLAAVVSAIRPSVHDGGASR